MKTISDPAKSINIVHETEVLVVGLGTGSRGCSSHFSED